MATYTKSELDRMLASEQMFEEVTIVLTPLSLDQTTYSLTVKNVGRTTLHQLQLIYAPLLHPGKFGLDDTHMPSDIWSQSPIEIETLEAYKSITFKVMGYDTYMKYDGPSRSSMTVIMKFGKSGVGTPKLYTVPVEIDIWKY